MYEIIYKPKILKEKIKKQILNERCRIIYQCLKSKNDIIISLNKYYKCKILKLSEKLSEKSPKVPISIEAPKPGSPEIPTHIQEVIQEVVQENNVSKQEVVQENNVSSQEVVPEVVQENDNSTQESIDTRDLYEIFNDIDSTPSIETPKLIDTRDLYEIFNDVDSTPSIETPKLTDTLDPYIEYLI